MRIIVTGGAGFVGAHIAQTLSVIGHDVTTIDIGPLPTALRGSSAPIEEIRCDVSDGRALKAAITSVEPDAVVHAAAVTPGADDVERAEEILHVNQLSTLSALLATKESGGRRFIYLSSAGVYRDPRPGEQLVERSALDEAGGLYAQTKIGSERLCRWAARELGLATTSLRVGPVYGEFERPTSSRTRMSPINRALTLAISQRSIICNARETVYNWIHGDDIGNAVALAVEHRGESSVYNIAGPAYSMAQTLEALVDQIPGTVVRWTESVNDANLALPKRSRPMSSLLIYEELGYRPSVELGTGISRTALAIERARSDACLTN
jgi:UDP-glucose 4-epimerase